MSDSRNRGGLERARHHWIGGDVLRPQELRHGTELRGERRDQCRKDGPVDVEGGQGVESLAALDDLMWWGRG